MELQDWRPRSRLVARRSDVSEPAFPVVDAHNHLGRWLSDDGRWVVPDVGSLLRVMDDAGVRHVVNLDGRWGDELEENLDRYDRAHPGRFSTFCHLDWAGLAQDDDEVGIVGRLTASLEASARAGAKGIKVWKDLGLAVRDARGALIAVDDPRVVAVLRAAGDLGLPVLIHTADPVAFFDPLDASNERWEELQAHPDWWFGAPGLPTFAALINALDRLLAACPGTTFLGAHVGCWAEDLDGVGAMLARHPHWNVDLGARLAEVGRQPRRFARFVAAFPDRVLFGTDAFPPDPEEYRRWYRFLETDDEHFAYSGEQVPPQGRWAVSGCALPQALLRAVYADNAQRLLRLP